MTTDPHRFRRLDSLFRAACSLDPQRRSSFLDEQCADDPDLRDEVLALLEQEESAPDFLERPALGGLIDADRLDLESLPAPPPVRIRNYRIIRVLGAGGMGVVYEAEQENPRRTVALKVIRSGAVSAELRRRFELETGVLARLRHPGIAHIYEAGHDASEDADRLFFAMELVRGVPLTTFADSAGLDSAGRLSLFALVCDAVHHAHQNGVIHRDLKPANIIVDTLGQPKILDFGVARALDPDLSTSQHTGAGQIIGTVAYMSPEQAAGDSMSMDIRGDVYSLGVNLFELLTGDLPYDVRDMSFLRAAEMIRDAQPRALGQRDRRLRGDVETIVRKALEKDRDRRYNSAAELAADIRRYLRREPILARPTTAMYQLRRLAQRNKPLFVGAALAILAMIGGTTASIVFAVRASRSEAVALADRNAAMIAKDAETRQRGIAERRFREVRALANTLLFRIADLIRDLPGSTEASRVVVSTAQQYLDTLAGEAGEDPELLDELADAYVRLADIQGNPSLANLGQSETARRGYERALDIRARLGAARPDSVINQLKLAAIHLRIGGQLAAAGCSLDGQASYERALAIQTAVVAAHPSDQVARRQLAASNSRIGDLERRGARHEDSLASYRAALVQTESCLAGAGPSTDALRDLAACMSDVGSALQSLDRSADALRMFEPALQIREGLAAATPNDRRAQRDVAIGLQRIGSLQTALDRNDAALVSFRRSAEILETLVLADPVDVRARGDLAVLHEKIGDVQAATARPSEALASYEQCQRLRAELILADPSNTWFRVGLAIARERSGDVLLQLGRRAEAGPRFRDALGIAESLVRIDPRDGLANAVVVMASRKLGDFHADLAARGARADPATRRELEESLRWYQRCLAALGAARDSRIALPDIAPPQEQIARAIAQTTAALAALDDSVPAAR